MAEPGGNLSRPSPQKPAGKLPAQASASHLVLLYATALFVATVVIIELFSGVATLPRRFGPSVKFRRDENPLMYWLCIALDCGMVFYLIFYAPYHASPSRARRWTETEASGDGYEGYKQPPRPIIPLKLTPLQLSDFCDPALLKSLLLVVCTFGFMMTAVGVFQAFTGTIYVPEGDTLDPVILSAEPQAFLMALIPYAIAGVVTALLATALYFWRPVRQAVSD